MSDKKWYQNPLFLPEGSVRALLAIGLVAAVIFTIFVTLPDGVDTGPLWALAGVAVTFYFTKRNGNGA